MFAAVWLIDDSFNSLHSPNFGEMSTELLDCDRGNADEIFMSRRGKLPLSTSQAPTLVFESFHEYGLVGLKAFPFKLLLRMPFPNRFLGIEFNELASSRKGSQRLTRCWY